MTTIEIGNDSGLTAVWTPKKSTTVNDYWDGCASPDAETILAAGDNHIRVFHVTKKVNEQSIVKSGLKANSASSNAWAAKEFGVKQEVRPSGVWVNNVPFLPYSIENSWIIGADDIAIFTMKVPATVSSYLECSWPFTQFLVQPEDCTDIELVPAEEFFRMRPAITEEYRDNLLRWSKETLGLGDEMENCRYLKRLTECN